MRKYYWYISIFFKKHGLVVLASVVVGIILISLFLTFGLQIFEFKKKSYIGVVGSYSVTSLPPDIEKEVSRGLTAVEDDGTAIPDLSERWSIEDEGKTYRFLLKKNTVWQDGEPLVPSDIKYSLRDVQIIPSQNEVIFKLKDQFVPFPQIVAHPLIRITTEPYLFLFKRKKIVGLGEYQVSKIVEKGQRLDELVTNNEHEEKIYRFYLTEQDAVQGFKRGEVDQLLNFTNTYDLDNWPNVQVNKQLDKQTYLGIFFNTEVESLGSNEIRQALNYALDKPADESRAIGPISPNSWAFAKVAKTYDFDENRGIERLLTPNGLPHKPISFALTTTPNFSDEADQIKKRWEEFGEKAVAACQKSSEVKEKQSCENLHINIDIRIKNYPDVNDFEALLIGQESPIDPDQYVLWHSDQSTNFTHYRNTRIDSLLEKGRQTVDQKKRFEIYSDFQQFFSEDAPVIFIKYLDKYDMVRGKK
jgi:peptide/nickel transport system substrate-binding protein